MTPPALQLRVKPAAEAEAGEGLEAHGDQEHGEDADRHERRARDQRRQRRGREHHADALGEPLRGGGRQPRLTEQRRQEMHRQAPERRQLRPRDDPQHETDEEHGGQRDGHAARARPPRPGGGPVGKRGLPADARR